MENTPFINDVPIKTLHYMGFSIATFDYRRVGIKKYVGHSESWSFRVIDGHSWSCLLSMFFSGIVASNGPINPIRLLFEAQQLAPYPP